MSQTTLAEVLDLTFQQIQKYERGTNRVSASKLWAIAAALNVPVSYFYEGLQQMADAQGRPDEADQRFLATYEGQRLAATFTRMPAALQRTLMSLMDEVSPGDPAGRG